MLRAYFPPLGAPGYYFDPFRGLPAGPAVPPGLLYLPCLRLRCQSEVYPAAGGHAEVEVYLLVLLHPAQGPYCPRSQPLLAGPAVLLYLPDLRYLSGPAGPAGTCCLLPQGDIDITYCDQRCPLAIFYLDF